MRLTHRIRRMESAAGIVSIRGARRVPRQEAEAAFARLRDALRADFVAIAAGVPSPVAPGDVERDIETLLAWASQRGLPGGAEVSRAEEEALATLSDDQLRAVVVALSESDGPSSTTGATP